MAKNKSVVSDLGVCGGPKMFAVVLITLVVGVFTGILLARYIPFLRSGYVNSRSITLSDVESTLLSDLNKYYLGGGDDFTATVAAQTYYGLSMFFGNSYRFNPAGIVLAAASEVRSRDFLTIPAASIATLPPGPCKDLLYAIKSAMGGDIHTASQLYASGKDCNIPGSEILKNYYYNLLNKK